MKRRGDYSLIEPALRMYERGQISGGKLRECLCAWADGKSFSVPEPDGMEVNYYDLYLAEYARSRELGVHLLNLLKYFGGPVGVGLKELGRDAYVELPIRLRLGDLMDARYAIDERADLTGERG